MDERDKSIYDKRKAKNDFEELIYKSREWVNEEANKVFFEIEKLEDYLTNLTTHQDWLDDEGYDQPKQVYFDKINEILDFYGRARQ